MNLLARAGNLLEASRRFSKHASRISWTSARINSERMMNWLWLYICMYICIYNYEHAFIMAKIWIIYSLFTYSKWLDVIICRRMPFSCTDCGWCIDRCTDRNKLPSWWIMLKHMVALSLLLYSEWEKGCTHIFMDFRVTINLCSFGWRTIFNFFYFTVKRCNTF